jgi:predicted GNAT family acetyltransferase
MSREILHDEARQRFTCDTDGHVTYLAYRRIGDRQVELYSTFTPPAARGRGIAARVVEEALHWAEANGLEVIPSCWFVAEYIERNPRYQTLTAAR